MDTIIPKQNHFFDKFYCFSHFPNSYYYGIIFSENNYFQRGATIMKILFYDTKSYDRDFFEKLLPSYPGIEIKFIEANIHEETLVCNLLPPSFPSCQIPLCYHS